MFCVFLRVKLMGETLSVVSKLCNVFKTYAHSVSVGGVSGGRPGTKNGMVFTVAGWHLRVEGLLGRKNA